MATGSPILINGVRVPQMQNLCTLLSPKNQKMRLVDQGNSTKGIYFYRSNPLTKCGMAVEWSPQSGNFRSSARLQVRPQGAFSHRRDLAILLTAKYAGFLLTCKGSYSFNEACRLSRIPLIKATESAWEYRLAISRASLMATCDGASSIYLIS